jgi:DNA-binding CsgD family transcriptional regulator
MGAAEELDRVSELCGRIAWSGTDGDVAREVLEPIIDFLGANSASFRWLAPECGTFKPITVGIPDSVNDAYLSRYYKLDPARRLVGRPLTAPLFASPVDDGGWSKERLSREKREQYRAEFRQYRAEFLLPSRFFHHVGFCIQDSGARTLLFDFHRPAESPEFGQLDRARTRAVAVYLHAKIRGRADAATASGASGLDAALSCRELEVAKAVAVGLSNKQIAATLNISVRTVENHLRSIFDKLGVTTRTRLAAKVHEAAGSPSGGANRAG